jgi:hypothetical protein
MPVELVTPEVLLGTHSEDPDELAVLAESSSFAVRHAVVRNPACPVPVLAALLNDAEATVHMGIAGNEATPVELLRDIAADEDKLFACQQHLISNKNTPADVLAAVARVTHHHVSFSDLIDHPNTSPELLTELCELSGHGQRKVRKEAASALALPVLSTISRDVRDVVRSFQAVDWIEPEGLVAVLSGALAALDARTFEIVDDVMDHAHAMAALGVAPVDILDASEILAALPESFLVAGLALVAEHLGDPIAAARAAKRLADNRYA